MLTRRKRTEVLVEGDRRVAMDLAARIESETPVEQVVAPRQGLVMNQVRETARNARFYLGEALMTECRVRVAGADGLGVVLGADSELSRALAVIDAAYAATPQIKCLSEVDARIVRAADELDAQRERDAARVLTSRVVFDEMGGQDMSVQAVVK